MHDSALVAFYRGDGRDHRGRLLSHILGFGPDELERHHDYIQWLFPLPEPSGANPSAPLLSKDDIGAFKSDESLREALIESLQLMLQFYGFHLVTRGAHVEIMRGANFDERSRVWLSHGNHNFLRISRMLRSMSLLGSSEHAQALLKRLEQVYAGHIPIIGTTTMGFWRRAVTEANE